MVKWVVLQCTAHINLTFFFFFLLSCNSAASSLGAAGFRPPLPTVTQPSSSGWFRASASSFSLWTQQDEYLKRQYRLFYQNSHKAQRNIHVPQEGLQGTPQLFLTRSRGFINISSRKAICFHRQAKLFELIFFVRKTFLQMVKPGRQIPPHSQSICRCPALNETQVVLITW